MLGAGGRFYFAKDSTLTPQAAAAFLGAEALGRFRAWKQRCDPENLLQGELYRRLLTPEHALPEAGASATSHRRPER